MKITLSLTFFLLCSILVFSQGIYTRGFIVRNEGDTLRGWINYGNWKTNPAKIEFKSDSNGRLATPYTVNEVKYFEIEGLDDYQKATVSLDMSSVDPIGIFNAVVELKDTTRTETVFLRVVSNTGKLHLYEFVDFKSHYFLQSANDALEELIYKLHLNRADNIVSEWNYYRQQLRGYAGENRSVSLDRKIDNSRYSLKSLSAIVAALNGDDHPTRLQAGNKRTETKNPQFFVTAGAALSTLSMPGDNDIPEGDLHFKGSFAPLLSAGVDFLSLRNFNDFTLRFEIAFSEYTYNGDKHTQDPFANPEYVTYNLKQQNISPSLSGIYNFHRTRKVRYYVGAGVAFNFSSYSGNRVTQTVYLNATGGDVQYDSLVLRNFWEGFILRAGARLNKKFEISALGNVTGRIIVYESFSGYVRSYALKLTYFLN